MTESARPGDIALMTAVCRPSGASQQGPQAVPAFEEIYEQHFDFVWRSLRRLGVHPSGLDDAVQDVFLVVHRRLLEFEGRSALKTWIFGIALHVAQRAARTRARHPADELHEAIADAHTPQDEAARREAIALLYAILDELDADKRAVFVMAELEQMTAPEIAELAGVPLNTVYSRLRAARREFEASLKRRQAHERWRNE
jgi:RNA polymerase sigma-70 factor, ECF subfamily